MDPQHADYADRDLPASPVPGLLAAVTCAAIGVGLKVAGDWQGGYRWCDLIAAVFIAAGVMIGWRAARRV